ncbi:MAG: DUF2520 domain-containing protein [Melioribacteraceae bacterium]|nr:DUF2520 domain-containing protein [Melioribacteraceae bacterium]
MAEMDDVKIAFIGAGKIAYSLVPAFIEKGFTVQSIISRDIKSAKDLADQNRIKNYYDNIGNDLIEADLIFLTVPDDSIEVVVNALLETRIRFDNKIIVHTSGAKSSKDISMLESIGVITASFHIMQTFPFLQRVAIEDSYTAIETQNESCFSLLQNISSRLNLKPFRIETELKVVYHLLGTIASNFLVEKFYNIENCYKKMNDDFPTSHDLLLPLINKTLENLMNKGSEKSLSGPIERGDLTTIKNHLAVIEGNSDFSLSYAAVSLNLVNLAETKGSIDRVKANELRKFLKQKIKELI